MTKFGCYNDVSVLNPMPLPDPNCLPDGSAFDFTKFDTIDLTYYGGQKYIPVTSNEDIINAFAALGYIVRIVKCSIVGITDGVDEDVPTCNTSQLVDVILNVVWC